MVSSAMTNAGKHVTSNMAFAKASDTQKIQSFDWLKWHCVLRRYQHSCLLLNQTSFLIVWQMGCQYVNYKPENYVLWSGVLRSYSVGQSGKHWSVRISGISLLAYYVMFYMYFEWSFKHVIDMRSTLTRHFFKNQNSTHFICYWTFYQRDSVSQILW